MLELLQNSITNNNNPAAIGGGTADWDRAKARSLVGGVTKSITIIIYLWQPGLFLILGYPRSSRKVSEETL